MREALSLPHAWSHSKKYFFFFLFTKRRSLTSLRPAHIRRQQVATNAMITVMHDQLRFALFANGADFARAARVEDAARGWVDRARDFARESQSAIGGHLRRGGDQTLRVGMVRAVEHSFCRADFHDPPQIQHRDPVGDIAHHAQIV